MFRNRIVACLAAGVVAVSMVACGDSKQEQERLNQLAIQRLEEQKTPEQKAEDAKRLADRAIADAVDKAMFSRMLNTAYAMRSIAKNPKSFELVSIVHIKKTDTACLVFRATNSFNAVVTESVAANAAGKAVDWNANCAGQPGTDWTKRVQASL